MTFNVQHWVAALVLVLSGACAPQDTLGQVGLALRATGASGTAYGLEATLDLVGPEVLSFDLAHQELDFQQPVMAGPYSATLRNYRLFKIEGSAATEVTGAVLTSPNPIGVGVPANGIGKLVFAFKVPEEAVNFDEPDVLYDEAVDGDLTNPSVVDPPGVHVGELTAGVYVVTGRAARESGTRDGDKFLFEAALGHQIASLTAEAIGYNATVVTNGNVNVATQEGDGGGFPVSSDGLWEFVGSPFVSNPIEAGATMYAQVLAPAAGVDGDGFDYEWRITVEASTTTLLHDETVDGDLDNASPGTDLGLLESGTHLVRGNTSADSSGTVYPTNWRDIDRFNVQAAPGRQVTSISVEVLNLSGGSGSGVSLATSLGTQQSFNVLEDGVIELTGTPTFTEPFDDQTGIQLVAWPHSLPSELPDGGYDYEWRITVE